KSADMTIGTATNEKATIVAVRVAGKSAQQVGEAMMSARPLNATTTKDELDLAGKHVVKVTTTIAPLPFYIYGAGDVSFTIAGADESIVAWVLAKRPYSSVSRERSRWPPSPFRRVGRAGSVARRWHHHSRRT